MSPELIQKLTADCETAKRVALRAIVELEDGGTCNLDSTFLAIEKGVPTKTVLDAVTSSGLMARPSKWLGRGVMISPPGTGQAKRRMASNEALLDSLKSAGWPVSPFYQMD